MKVNKDIFSHVIVYLAMFFLTLSYIFPLFYYLFMIAIVVATFVFFYELHSNKQCKVSDVNFIIFFMLVMVLMMPSLLIKELHLEYFKQAVIMLLMVCSGFFLSNSRSLNLSLARLPFFSLSVYYIFLWIKGVPASQFLQSNSENFVSVSLFLAYFLSFSLSKKYEVDLIVIVMGSILFFLSLISVGRSGIITSGFIFAMTSVLYFHSVIGRFKQRIVRVCVNGAILILLVPTSMFLIDLLFGSGLLDRIINRGFTDYSREFIISKYIDNLLNLNSLLGGVDIYLIDEYFKYGYNLHNSYLSIHSFFGLFFLTTYLITIVFVVFRLFIDKNFILLIPVISILVRSLTDIQILGGKLDWIVFYLFFMLMKGNKRVLTREIA